MENEADTHAANIYSDNVYNENLDKTIVYIDTLSEATFFAFLAGVNYARTTVVPSAGEIEWLDLPTGPGWWYYKTPIDKTIYISHVGVTDEDELLTFEDNLRVDDYDRKWAKVYIPEYQKDI